MFDFREVVEFLRDILGYIITISIFAFIFIFIIAIVPVSGNSMNPSINDGDLTVVFRMSYLFTEVKRGDIVNIKLNNKKVYVKRIIGLPGESIKYINDNLYVNDKIVSENYLDESVETYNFVFEDICSIEQCPNGKIPNDMYLVLGDNRIDSFDSRNPDIGLISKKNLKGKVYAVIWPFENFKIINYDNILK